MLIRFAKEEDLNMVNELRRQVNDLHVEGRPDVFRGGFCDELRDYLHVIWEDPEQEIVTANSGGTIRGYAVLRRFHKSESPFKLEQDYLSIEEFGVDRSCRRQGIGSAMVAFIRDLAEKEGFPRVELNMWEFNREALAFYEAAGFTTYRRYLEMKL